MGADSLAPGYHQVDAFGPDDDYERDENGEIIEEVSYVTLDLGAVEPTLVPSSSTYRLIGLDTPTPFLQLSGTIFQGSHQSLLGTELLFSEDKDHYDQNKRTVSHLANTSQRIRFKQVEIQPKGAPPELPEPLTRGKGKGTSGKPKAQTMDHVDAVDLLTGSFDPREATPSTRRGGKGKSTRGGELQVIQSQPDVAEDVEMEIEPTPAPEAA
ncbi:hypothetical protein BC834DRAFT_974482 [Gloeopeniophorella convolvens]|nr:hypothetical protein BC834DRAFT_974482 [Gloeopeniophorella convolvens]